MEYGTFLASELFAMSSAAVHTGRPIIKRAASDVCACCDGAEAGRQ